MWFRNNNHTLPTHPKNQLHTLRFLPLDLTVRHWRDTRRKSSSSNRSDVDSALQSGPESTYDADDDLSFRAASPARVGSLYCCTTDTVRHLPRGVCEERHHNQRCEREPNPWYALFWGAGCSTSKEIES